MGGVSIVVVVGFAVAIGIFLANWMERGHGTPLSLPPELHQAEPQTVDEYVRRHYSNIAY